MNEETVNTNLRFEFKVDLKKVRHIPVHKDREIKKEPALRQKLILAYQLQQLFDEDKVKSLKQVADWLHMTHARISQIMSLMLLAPGIQEEILLSANENICDLTERRIRKVAMEVDWEKQKESWKTLTDSTYRPTSGSSMPGARNGPKVTA